MGYQWGKSPLGAAGWKSRALAAEERVWEYRAEIVRLQAAVGDARTERNAARHEVERTNRSAWDAIERMTGKVEDLRGRSERNAARVRMLAGDLRDARDALDEVGRIRQQWRTVLELRRRLDVRADRVEALAGNLRNARAFFRHLERTLEKERDALDDARGLTRQQWLTVVELRGRLDSRADRVEALARRAREYRTESRMLRDDLAWEREVSRINREQLERSLAAAQARAVEAEEKAAAPAPPAPNVVAWEARVRDLEGALRDQQSITETWKREAGDARRAVTMLRSALNSARFNAAHTGSEAARVLEQTEEIDSRYIRKG